MIGLTKFKYDNWYADFALKDHFLDLFSINQNEEILVADSWYVEGGYSHWNQSHQGFSMVLEMIELFYAYC